ncbi:MAG: glycosyltransferase [Candidatus Neomarinimicrobiota bacterium]
MMVFAFWAVGGIILLYLVLLVWMRTGLRRLAPTTDTTVTPDVSIIVAARNEALNIPRLLAALQRQSYPADRLEIIVVDDGSTDDTFLILQLHARKMSNLHPIRIDHPPAGWGPKKWALTTAVNQAKGEIILTTDADCIPGPHWVERMVRYFANPAVGMVMGPSPLVTERRSFWREALFLDSCAMDALTAGGLARGLALTCTGRNLAYRKRIFEELGGFKGVEHFVSGDDDLLMQKVAATRCWRITFAAEAEATVPSPPPATVGAFVRQRLRFASKGRYYFGLDTGPWFKLILPFLYLTNLAAVTGLVLLALILHPLWLAPIAIKMAAEALLVYPYLRRINRSVRVATFIIAGLVHPLYVVVFGAFGNLHKLAWKGRHYESSRVSATNVTKPG